MKKNYAFITAIILLKLNSWAQAPNISYATPQTYTVGTAITPLTPVNTGGAVTPLVSTFAGSGMKGMYNGTGTSATFWGPLGVAVDASGALYVADTYNNIIKKISPLGVVSTLAGDPTWGDTDGTGTSARFNAPVGVAVDASGIVYVSDSYNNKIRKITPLGEVSTLATSFKNPHGLAIDTSGSVYVADTGNNDIRKISPSGDVSVLAGSGSGSHDDIGMAASFNAPVGVAVDASGIVYVADSHNNKIRKITPLGEVSTLAGSGNFGSDDGSGTSASFGSPFGITVDASGNIYVSDYDNNNIRKISPSGIVSTLTGSGARGSVDGTSTSASFYYPTGVAVDAFGAVYVADQQNNKIRKIIQGYSISPKLPAGLSFDNVTGIISGTSTVSTAATTYTITAYNSKGNTSTTISIETATLSANTFAIEGLKLYPNPTNSLLNLQAPNIIGFNNIKIIDLMGKIVLEQTNNNNQLNVEKLASGMYIIEASSEEQKFTAKFVKE